MHLLVNVEEVSGGGKVSDLISGWQQDEAKSKRLFRRGTSSKDAKNPLPNYAQKDLVSWKGHVGTGHSLKETYRVSATYGRDPITEN